MSYTPARSPRWRSIFFIRNKHVGFISVNDDSRSPKCMLTIRFSSFAIKKTIPFKRPILKIPGSCHSYRSATRGSHYQSRTSACIKKEPLTNCRVPDYFRITRTTIIRVGIDWSRQLFGLLCLHST